MTKSLELIYKVNLKKAETTEGQGFQAFDPMCSVFAETLAARSFGRLNKLALSGITTPFTRR